MSFFRLKFLNFVRPDKKPLPIFYYIAAGYFMYKFLAVDY